MKGVTLTPADPIRLPGAFAPWSQRWEVDCNSPSHWEGDILHVFCGAGESWRSIGPDIQHLGEPVRVIWDRPASGGRWIEATYLREDGVLFGWYHLEPLGLFDEANRTRENALTAPRIGAGRSLDHGLHWEDLGIIIQTPESSDDPENGNYFFAGGNGDFCVVPDRQGEYLVFLFGSYQKGAAQQGVCVGRVPVSSLDDPVGVVKKLHKGSFDEPGLGGQVTPVFPVQSDWNSPHPDAFWGPSVHWNTVLEKFVMVLNRAIDPRWGQEGIYLSQSDDLVHWSEPEKILDGGGWYPMIFGETDKEAGESARLFLKEESRFEIRFMSQPE